MFLLELWNAEVLEGMLKFNCLVVSWEGLGFFYCELFPGNLKVERVFRVPILE